MTTNLTKTECRVGTLANIGVRIKSHRVIRLVVEVALDGDHVLAGILAQEMIKEVWTRPVSHVTIQKPESRLTHARENRLVPIALALKIVLKDMHADLGGLLDRDVVDTTFTGSGLLAGQSVQINNNSLLSSREFGRSPRRIIRPT